jgi:predicted acylesterase/phospholipase RssA
MRIPLAIPSIALIALNGPVSAGPDRACEQVSALVDGAVGPLLANQAEPQPEANQLGAQFRACLSSRNICGVLYNTRYRREALVQGDVTADLPAPAMSDQGQSSVIVVVRSIPRVRNDSNQYCLVSQKFSGATSVQQWDVYGWVIAPNAGEALPLQREALHYNAVSDPGSPRALAAALWFFAARMSGQSSGQ